MSLKHPEIEGLLTETYRRQTANYTRALAMADKLFANWTAVTDVVGALQPISAVIDEIRQSNSAVEKSRQKWAAPGQRPGPELAAALQECSAMILRLKDRIAELERLAAERKQRLTPELDNFARGWQMQRAYAAAAKA